MAEFNIRNLTRQRLPRLPFLHAVESALPGWDVSLVLIGPARARSLNEHLRGKSYVPNVLSYAVGSTSGEIIICPTEAKKQAPNFGLSVPNFVFYLFIHGLLHLKGRVHGATMERSERALMAKFLPSAASSYSNVPPHSYRNRHRHIPSKVGGR